MPHATAERAAYGLDATADARRVDAVLLGHVVHDAPADALGVVARAVAAQRVDVAAGVEQVEPDVQVDAGRGARLGILAVQLPEHARDALVALVGRHVLAVDGAALLASRRQAVGVVHSHAARLVELSAHVGLDGRDARGVVLLLGVALVAVDLLDALTHERKVDAARHRLQRKVAVDADRTGAARAVAARADAQPARRGVCAATASVASWRPRTPSTAIARHVALVARRSRHSSSLSRGGACIAAGSAQSPSAAVVAVVVVIVEVVHLDALQPNARSGVRSGASSARPRACAAPVGDAAEQRAVGLRECAETFGDVEGRFRAALLGQFLGDAHEALVVGGARRRSAKAPVRVGGLGGERLLGAPEEAFGICPARPRRRLVARAQRLGAPPDRRGEVEAGGAVDARERLAKTIAIAGSTVADAIHTARAWSSSTDAAPARGATS